VVVSNIERHTALFKDEVTLQHIREEGEARSKALVHFDQATEFQQLQKFQVLKTLVSPKIYDDRLDWLLTRSSRGSARWLVSDKIFLQWLEVTDENIRLLWLQGIPGAGKSPLYLLDS
jgi:hypothetical protein